VIVSISLEGVRWDAGSDLGDGGTWKRGNASVDVAAPPTCSALAGYAKALLTSPTVHAMAVRHPRGVENFTVLEFVSLFSRRGDEVAEVDGIVCCPRCTLPVNGTTDMLTPCFPRWVCAVASCVAEDASFGGVAKVSGMLMLAPWRCYDHVGELSNS
jgi:hypothetical protein